MHIAQVMLDRMGQTPSLSAPLSLGGGHPFAAEARSIRADADRFEADLGRGCVLELRRRADRGKVPIRLFSIEDSTCGLTAEWAERRGMPAQHIATSLKSPPLLLEWGRSLHGHLVRVVPGAGFTFEGLASALDEAESAARDALPEPFHRVDDPWYDGRRHGYTLVDVPHCSSVLSADEVRAVILRCFG